MGGAFVRGLEQAAFGFKALEGGGFNGAGHGRSW